MIEIKFEQHLNIQNTELGFDLEVAEVRQKKELNIKQLLFSCSLLFIAENLEFVASQKYPVDSCCLEGY